MTFDIGLQIFHHLFRRSVKRLQAFRKGQHRIGFRRIVVRREEDHCVSAGVGDPGIVLNQLRLRIRIAGLFADKIRIRCFLHDSVPVRFFVKRLHFRCHRLLRLFPLNPLRHNAGLQDRNPGYQKNQQERGPFSLFFSQWFFSQFFSHTISIRKHFISGKQTPNKKNIPNTPEASKVSFILYTIAYVKFFNFVHTKKEKYKEKKYDSEQHAAGRHNPCSATGLGKN